MTTDERRLYEELSKRMDDFRTDVNVRFDELRSDVNTRIEEFRGDVNSRLDENNRRMNNMQTTMVVAWITILGAVIGLSFT